MATDARNEQTLSTWGSGTLRSDATRAGDIVLKSSGRWSSAVIALLQHLERVGFIGAPRVVEGGYASDGRMMLGYVPGESPHPGAWSDDQVGRVGELLRQLHNATSTFVAPPGADWQTTPDSAEAVDESGYPALWAITWRARSASWMMRHRAMLLKPGS